MSSSVCSVQMNARSPVFGMPKRTLFPRQWMNQFHHRGVFPAAARLEDVHNLGLAPEARELEPAAGNLAERRHVRTDVVVLLGASVGEAEAGEDLVEDQDDALLPRELSQALEVIGLRRNDPRAAEH